MKKEYDAVFLTNTPSFYKLNLCSALAMRGKKLLIVFYGYGSEAVNTILSRESCQPYDFCFLNDSDTTKRRKPLTFVKLLRLMAKIKYKYVIFPGWMSLEYSLFSFLSPRKKNILLCESSIFDGTRGRFKDNIKRLLVRRMGKSLPSGTPHEELLSVLGFKGASYITGSVGIFNKENKEYNIRAEERVRRVGQHGFSFLYVGRLVWAKNILLMIECFNRNGLPLTIVGDGAIRRELQEKAHDNIQIIGFVSNDELYKIYNAHDVFILPSRYEPWGLVVEEALFRGLPVIYSDKVGSGPDMVNAHGAGVMFDYQSIKSLQSAIDEMVRNYPKYIKGASAIDFHHLEELQIHAYLDAIDSK